MLSTTQPPEPILAFISAQDMLEYPSKRLTAVEALYDNVSKGFIRLDDIGETIAALILMFTFDRAHGLRDPTPIKFSTFIETLLPQPTVLEIKSRVGDSENMKALWDHGLVFFSHFVRLTEKPTEKKPSDWIRPRGSDISTSGIQRLRYPYSYPCPGPRRNVVFHRPGQESQGRHIEHRPTE